MSRGRVRYYLDHKDARLRQERQVNRRKNKMIVIVTRALPREGETYARVAGDAREVLRLIGGGIAVAVELSLGNRPLLIEWNSDVDHLLREAGLNPEAPAKASSLPAPNVAALTATRREALAALRAKLEEKKIEQVGEMEPILPIIDEAIEEVLRDFRMGRLG